MKAWSASAGFQRKPIPGAPEPSPATAPSCSALHAQVPSWPTRAAAGRASVCISCSMLVCSSGWGSRFLGAPIAHVDPTLSGIRAKKTPTESQCCNSLHYIVPVTGARFLKPSCLERGRVQGSPTVSCLPLLFFLLPCLYG